MAIFIDENMLHCPNADCRGIEFEKVVIKAFNVGPKNKEFAKTMLLEANSRVLFKRIKSRIINKIGCNALSLIKLGENYYEKITS